MIEQSSLIISKEGIVSQLERLWTRLDLMGALYLGDEPNVSPNTFDTAELKVLLCRLSCNSNTRGSQTIPLLYQILTESTTGVFIDRSYLPPRGDLMLFEKHHVPLYFGVSSKEPARNFDIVGISNAIVMEAVNLPRMLYSSGIPLMFSERMKDETCPLILLGGCNVRNSESLCGDISEAPHTGTGGFIDAAVVGAGEVSFPAIVEFVKGAKKRGLTKKEILLELAASNTIDGLYLPWAYEEIRDGKNLVKIRPKAEYVGVVPEKILSASIRVEDHKPLTKDFISYSGQNGCSDLEISRGCGVGSCTFCQEGMTERPYNQRSFDKLKEYYLEARVYEAASTAGCYSFNWSSHTQIYELLRFLYKNFGNVNLISNRIDMINDNKELLKISHHVGNKHWTTGIEGFSDRLRSALHKNAPEATILKAIEDAMRVGFVSIKLFFICTGKETEEDLDECCLMLRKIAKLQVETGQTCYVSMSVTPLFSMSHTPVQWQPVILGLTPDMKSLRKVVDTCHELHFGFRTAQKQAVVSILNTIEQGDRRLTGILAKSSIVDDFTFYGKTSDKAKGKWTAHLKAKGLEWVDYLGAKAKDYVFPWDHISFGVSKEWLWKRFQMFERYEEDISCMGHRKVCEDKGELILDDKGVPKWDLILGKCEGCKACHSPQYIKELSKGTISADRLAEIYPVDSLIPFARNTNAVLRFKYEIDKKHAGVSKAVWSTVLARGFLMSNPYASEVFNKTLRASLTQIVEEDIQPIYGVDYCDIGLTEYVPIKALDLLAIQRECKGITILETTSSVKTSPFSRNNPYNYYEVEFLDSVEVSMHELVDAFYGIDDRTFKLRKYESATQAEKKTVNYTLKGSEVGKFWLYLDRKTIGMAIRMELDPLQIISSLTGIRRSELYYLPVRSFGGFRYSDKDRCKKCGEFSRLGMIGEILPCVCTIS
jgi:radical SAM superfamily enzyme YgiQ (UPF0313 family)